MRAGDGDHDLVRAQAGLHVLAGGHERGHLVVVVDLAVNHVVLLAHVPPLRGRAIGMDMGVAV